jgi:hypothetical protein
MSTSRLFGLLFFTILILFNDLWLFVFAPTHQKNGFVWMTLIPVLCHVSMKISIFVLLVCKCTLWSDNTCVFTRFHSVKNANTQLIWSSVELIGRNPGMLLAVRLDVWNRFRRCTSDRIRSGRPRVTSRRQDNHIRLVHLRNRFQTSSLTARSIPGLRPISSRTVGNRLREHNIRPRRPAINTAATKRLTLNDASVCISFYYTAVNTRTAITAV